MLILALSDAAKTTISAVIIWFVAFPALIGILIAVSAFRAHGEKMEDEEYFRQHRRR